MSLYIQGDVEAFDELYRRHKAKVYGYLVKRLPSKQLADEVFQVAFLKLHQARNQYRDQQDFLPWLFTIARNSLYDCLRKHRSETNKVTVLKEQLDSMEELTSSSSISSPIDEALAHLSEPQRELLTQRYVEGLEFEEIAKRSKSSAAAVRQSVSRVTRKLRSLIKGGA